jgi:cation diffusion facilitator CzcD-associated flavoprotein CzcO
MTSDTTDVAVIGAGPYGLSVASHLARAGVEHRIFGSAMQTWRAQMPEGMLLRSEGWASSISDPAGAHSFGCFVSDRRPDAVVPRTPVRLGTFLDYSDWFIEQEGITVEDRRLDHLEHRGSSVRLSFSDDGELEASRVVLAVGLTHFPYVPAELACLPDDVLSHSSRPLGMSEVAGRRIAVIGAGQSALETAALLHEHDADVVVFARTARLRWHGVPPPDERPLIERLRAPMGGLGLGWKSWVAGAAPGLIRRIPTARRVDLSQRAFGPAGAWWLRERVEGRVDVRLATGVCEAVAGDATVRLTIRGPEGREAIEFDHVVAATGYRVDLGRLTFLDEQLRASMEMNGTNPALTRHFESSVPGLHFVGAPATNTFGPVMRFVFGTPHAARGITHVAARARRVRRR